MPGHGVSTWGSGAAHLALRDKQFTTQDFCHKPPTENLSFIKQHFGIQKSKSNVTSLGIRNKSKMVPSTLT